MGKNNIQISKYPMLLRYFDMYIVKLSLEPLYIYLIIIKGEDIMGKIPLIDIKRSRRLETATLAMG